MNERPDPQKKTKHQQAVEEFMVKGAQDIPDVPTMPDEKTRILRVRLLMEEVLEYADAAGVGLYDTETRRTITFDDIEFLSSGAKPDLIEMADANADISVVNVGAMSAAGIKDCSLLYEVDANNLLKFVELGPCPDCHGGKEVVCYRCGGTQIGGYMDETMASDGGYGEEAIGQPLSCGCKTGREPCSTCQGRGTLGGYRDDFGKWTKPLQHPHPDIVGVLAAQSHVHDYSGENSDATVCREGQIYECACGDKRYAPCVC